MTNIENTPEFEYVQSRLDEARAQLAAAQERVRVLHESLRDMAQSWRNLADGLGTAPYHDGKRDALRECADDLARTFDAALAGTEPAKE